MDRVTELLSNPAIRAGLTAVSPSLGLGIEAALSRKELVHHIDGDKGNNDLENLLVCHNSKEHNRIHGQLEALAFLLYQKGTIKFCHDCRLYFLDKCYCSV